MQAPKHLKASACRLKQAFVSASAAVDFFSCSCYTFSATKGRVHSSALISEENNPMKTSTSRTVSAKVLHSIVSVLLVFAMIFVFSACQSNTVDPNETVNIGGGSEGEHNTPLRPQIFPVWFAFRLQSMQRAHTTTRLCRRILKTAFKMRVCLLQTQC